jgi:PadR family transcriptional regulator PadR
MNTNVSDLLTLNSAQLHILLALLHRSRHGYAIMVDVLESTGGTTRLWPATLYNTLKKLADAGLITQVEDPEGSEDARRRAYALTDLGAQALDQEADRMQSLVDAVRAKRSEARS